MINKRMCSLTINTFERERGDLFAHGVVYVFERSSSGTNAGLEYSLTVSVSSLALPLSCQVSDSLRVINGKAVAHSSW